MGAKDADGIRGTRDVEVKVTNVNEDGTVTLSAVQPRVGLSLTASLTDIDGPVTAVKWQWSNNGDIADATSDTYTPTADDVDDTLTATATYTDPQGPEHMASGGSANPVAADTRNKAPVFDDQDDGTDGIQNATTTRTIEENSNADTALNGGGPITATDPNAPGDLVSYTLGGPDASSFGIGLTTGQITVGAGTMLDYETKTSYMVTVIATDSYGATASIDVTITVTDVNEGPVFGEVQEPGTKPTNNAPAFAAATDTREVAENTAAGENIDTPVAATDADAGDTLIYTLGGDDAASFDIDLATGQIMTKAALDFETKASYSVTVTASDGTDDDTITVTITVTDVDEHGMSDPLADRYDANSNGMIEKSEVLAAIDDYLFSQTLTKDEVLEVIDLYLFPS